VIGLDELKGYWETPAKIAAWLIGLVSLFVIEPPRLWHSTSELVGTSNPGQWLHVAQFILAVLVGVFFLKSARPETRPRMRWLALGALVLALAVFVVNQFLIAAWTCGYLDEVVVIGETYSELASAQLNAAMTCTRLMGLAHGESSELWPANEILLRYTIIAGLYTVTMLSFAVAALATIDYVRAGQKAQGERDDQGESDD
jgi:hypothetical protein